MTQCPHCGVPHEKHEWMFHRANCPNGRVSADRLVEIPSWKLEEELLRRGDPRCLTELANTCGRSALEHATMLTDVLILMRTLANLTRYALGTHITTRLNVPNSLLFEIDCILARRGIPPRNDSHAD